MTPKDLIDKNSTDENSGVIDKDKVEKRYKEFPPVANYELHIETDPSKIPKQRMFSIVPRSLEKETKDQIDEWVAQGVNSRVSYRRDSCISSLLVVMKPNGKARCCVDFVELNKAILTKGHKYKMPTIQDMKDFAHGGEWFCTMDLRNAFMHVKLSEASRWLTCFRTPWGLFVFNRMPFGLNIASETFQCLLDGLFAHLPFVKIYLDDILIKASSREELAERKKLVQKVIDDNNLHVNTSKTIEEAQEIDFVGFMISGKGVKLTDNRVQAIRNMKAPSNCKELRSFLGKVNFLSQSTPNLMEISSPLWKLLKEPKFVWLDIHQKSFEKIKDEICNSKETMHFDENKETFLITDAAPEAIASMLFQRNKEGKSSVVGFSSHLLSKTQQNYPHFQKEILAIVTGVEHFRRYLRNREFNILTDLAVANNIISKSLRDHYHELKRHDKWTMFLREYTFRIIHIPGILNIADALSRLCTTSTPNKNEQVIDSPCVARNNHKANEFEFIGKDEKLYLIAQDSGNIKRRKPFRRFRRDLKHKQRVFAVQNRSKTSFALLTKAPRN